MGRSLPPAAQRRVAEGHPMRYACFFVAFAFLLSALVLARSRHRVRQWPRVKANVVHWREAAPFGEPAQPRIRHERIVTQQDGSEVVFVSSRPNPKITYFAELVYFVGGHVFAADLAFDEPSVDSVDLLIDPENSRNYDFPTPSYRGAFVLGGLGLLFLFFAVP